MNYSKYKRYGSTLFWHGSKKILIWNLSGTCFFGFAEPSHSVTREQGALTQQQNTMCARHLLVEPKPLFADELDML